MGYRLTRRAGRGIGRGPGRGGLALVLAAVVAVLSAAPAADAQQVLARRNALTVYLLDCGPVASVEVRSPDGRLFANDLGDFGTIVRTLRFVVPSACQEATKITIAGTVGGTLWFAGAVGASDDWRLVSLYAPPE